jgi:uncharacterized repeat protein (TIGR01451 family)
MTWRILSVKTTLLMLVAFWMPSHVHAVGVTAGTIIQNIAQIEYTAPSGVTFNSDSNAAIIRVEEILDVIVSRHTAIDYPVIRSSLSQPLAFRVTNSGNGQEAFRLSATHILGGDQFDPLTTRIAIDTNGNGQYDPLIDAAYVSGQNDLVLAPDQSGIVFILGDIPASLQNGDKSFVNLTATSVTGTGTPGTTFAGQGNGNSDAVVGSTTAQSFAQNIYLAALVDTQFVKTQNISDPQGGNSVVPGAIVTYTLVARISGTGTIENAVINDSIPADTNYVFGSLRLNGTALSDAVDTDAGQFNSNAVSVALGTLAAPATQTISFQVKIN